MDFFCETHIILFFIIEVHLQSRAHIRTTTYYTHTLHTLPTVSDAATERLDVVVEEECKGRAHGKQVLLVGDPLKDSHGFRCKAKEKRSRF